MVEENEILKNITPEQINKRYLKRKVRNLLSGIKKKIPENSNFANNFDQKIETIIQNIDTILILETTFQYQLVNIVLAQIENTSDELNSISDRIGTCSELDSRNSLMDLVLVKLDNLNKFLDSVINEPETVYRELKFQFIKEE